MLHSKKNNLFNIVIQCRKCLSYDCRITFSFATPKVKCNNCKAKEYLR